MLLVAAAWASLTGLQSAAAQDACGDATNDCFTTNLFSGGCSNPVCCGLVCTAEPSCCDVAWDDVCVAIAEKYCSDCGLVKDSCFQPHATPSCNNGKICEAVCASVGFEYCCSVRWDEGCVQQAIELTNDCGDGPAGSCLVVHENPNCRDAECCETVCGIDPRCCDTTWDQACVNWAERFCRGCGNPRAGSCCYSQPTPFCNDAICCEAVCNIDPFCCAFRWDEFCAQLATDNCNIPRCLCGVDVPFQNSSCRAVHESPGCNDARCCDAVCYFDVFCCEVEWDFTCVQVALAECALTPSPDINATCSSATGSCFFPHGGEGCSQPACCGTVCVIDPSCCDSTLGGWDQACADLAIQNCNECGSIDAGSCFYPHETPGCLDRECCDNVCVIDPSCCEIEWDIFCVINAGTYCLDSAVSCGDPRTRPCAVPSYLPSCEDERCCAYVCNVLDPTCCSRAWDETCAANAVFGCPLGINNCPAAGSPLVVHGNPGCSDELCCSAVCSVDPLCCSFGWSAECVAIAKGICVTFGDCPQNGPCDSTHPTPGCEDATCCTVVCQNDPVCCEVSWSTSCVQAARSLCVPRNSWPCPCVGSCFEAHPETGGCEDEVCCAGVCNVDPTCCTESWDSGCVSIARITCCTFPGCGDICTGSCLVPHESPYCDDASCCEAVCRYEPYCCDVRWDSSCVLEARRTCIGGCGLPVSGNCFAVHNQPGCNRGDCCNAVCAAEEFEYCCQVSWDQDCVDRASKLCKDEIPECGRIGLPGCNLPHNSPSCSDEDCCSAICDIDPFCCENEWDASCVERIYGTAGCERYQAECGGRCAGTCCEAHLGPWCNDEACCDAICLIDIFCCSTQWDEFCASQARINKNCRDACPPPECGTPEAGNCCFPHDNANCNDQSCCDVVCAIDSTCCEAIWDQICASIANDPDSGCEQCTGGSFCGDPKAGSCCNEHENVPFCESELCCSFVCSFDETCCISGWDTTCVKLAQAFCGCGG
jgi:hypothetical protein